MRILIVEDEEKLANLLRRGLEAESYTCDVAHDGETALAKATEQPFDLILLDLILPTLSGYEVCQRLRAQENAVPIIMLTAREATEDKVRGLDLGADDYLTKPFKFQELLARIRAVMRRKDRGIQPGLTAGELALDYVQRKVTFAGREVAVTPREFDLIALLMRHVNQTVSRATIAQSVWHGEIDAKSNTIEVYMNYLRKKLKASAAPDLIKTIRGSGYRMIVPERPAGAPSSPSAGG